MERGCCSGLLVKGFYFRKNHKEQAKIIQSFRTNNQNSVYKIEKFMNLVSSLVYDINYILTKHSTSRPISITPQKTSLNLNLFPVNPSKKERKVTYVTQLTGNSPFLYKPYQKYYDWFATIYNLYLLCSKILFANIKKYFLLQPKKSRNFYYWTTLCGKWKNPIMRDVTNAYFTFPFIRYCNGVLKWNCWENWKVNGS